MKLIRTNEETFYCEDGDIISVGEKELQVLRDEVGKTSRKRIRICCHSNLGSAIHEMFVCYMRDTNIQPHKHLAKDESFYVVEGELDFILYNKTGDVTHIIPMGEVKSGRQFHVLVPRDTYHKVVMTSEYCILFERTPGPFDREHTVWAAWK